MDAGFARTPGSAGVEMAELAHQEDADEPAAKTSAVLRAMAKSQKSKTQVARMRYEQTAVGDADDEEEWAVQVGSFSQAAKAVQVAEAALDKMGKYGEDGEAKAISAKNGKHVVYHARIVGLTKEDAKGACRSLNKRHQPCRALNLG
jgi:hypothetical protein